MAGWHDDVLYAMHEDGLGCVSTTSGEKGGNTMRMRPRMYPDVRKPQGPGRGAKAGWGEGMVSWAIQSWMWNTRMLLC